ncbi:MAG: ABC transporter permease, partial [Planctomycetota bacterium]
MPDPEGHAAVIREVLGDDLKALTVSVNTPAMLSIDFGNTKITRHVSLVGIDTETYDDVSQYRQFLLHPEHQRTPDFDLRDEGYAPNREGFPESGWAYRRQKARYDKARAAEQERIDKILLQARSDSRAAVEGTANPGSSSNGEIAMIDGDPQPVDGSEGDANDDGDEMMNFSSPANFENPQAVSASEAAVSGPGDTLSFGTGENAIRMNAFDAEVDQMPGIVLGIATCTTKSRDADGKVREYFYCRPGDDVTLMFPNASESVRVVEQSFTVANLYESKMSEYDGSFAFCSLQQLQQLRGMIDPGTGTSSVTTIQIALVEGADLDAARDALQRRFPQRQFAYSIQTWRDMQGPLLAAVQLETTILNLLLFLIIAVAGFGIL